MADSPEKDETVSPETAEDEAPEDDAGEHDAGEHDAGEHDAGEPAAGTDGRPAAVDELWQELRVDPVKLALPGGVVGFTLRAYRPASQLAPVEAPAEAEEDDPFAERERQRAAEDAAIEELGLEIDETELAEEATAGAAADDDEEADADEAAAEEDADKAESDSDDEDEDEDEDEDVPVFLSHRGKLLLFGTPESLVSFINSDAPHDLTQLDTWPAVAKRVSADDIVPADADTYELDLVVENLRGGHDAWDLPLLISAGEFARDIGYALRLKSIINALAPGSPLDDLDEVLRAAETGRFGGLLARRRMRKFSTTQTSQGWRTVIGKISAAVDWRD